MVVDRRENKSLLLANERYQNELQIFLILKYKDVERLDSGIYELVGDIEDEFNRDISLTEDGGDCLSTMVEVVFSEIFITEGSQEEVGALVECRVTYRHSFRNTRTKEAS